MSDIHALLAPLIAKARTKAITAYSMMYDCPINEVECELKQVGPDSPTTEWVCWRRDSFEFVDGGYLDLSVDGDSDV